MMTIAYYRGSLDEYKEHQRVVQLIEQSGDCDYIIAPIADNRMFPIINSFRMSQALEDNLITHTSNKTVVEEKRLLFYFNQKSGCGSDAVFYVIDMPLMFHLILFYQFFPYMI